MKHKEFEYNTTHETKKPELNFYGSPLMFEETSPDKETAPDILLYEPPRVPGPITTPDSEDDTEPEGE